MALNPVGPRSPGVYWARRLVVLVVLVVVVLLVLKACGDDSADVSTRSATPSPTSSGRSASPTGTATASPPPTRTPSRTPSPTPSPSAPVRGCTDGDIKVSVTTDARTYRQGVDPRFTLTVRNTSGTPCRRDVGPLALELRVTSGSADIWSSDSCKPKGASAVTTLPVKGAYNTVVAWTRIRLAASCPADKPAALPGTYRVTGRAGTAVSGPTAFVLA